MPMPAPQQPTPTPGLDFHGGLLHTQGPGRTDNLDINVPQDAYVIPADVVSSLGEGNTLAGARKLQHMLGMPPAPMAGAFRRAVPGMVAIVAAGGEFVVHPSIVRQLGNGDMKSGHQALDLFVKKVRAKAIKTMSRLPGPKK